MDKVKSFNIYDTLEEFSPDYSVFCEDDFDISKLKKIIYTRLTETDRRIILAYAQLGNIRDVAALLKVSPTTIFNEIRKIRNKIYEYFY